MSSSNDLTRATSHNAYLSWNTARDTLYQSIQSYAIASNLLGSSLIHSSFHYLPSHDLLEQFDSEFARCLEEQQTSNLRMLPSSGPETRPRPFLRVVNCQWKYYSIYSLQQVRTLQIMTPAIVLTWNHLRSSQASVTHGARSLSNFRRCGPISNLLFNDLILMRPH